MKEILKKMKKIGQKINHWMKKRLIEMAEGCFYGETGVDPEEYFKKEKEEKDE